MDWNAPDRPRRVTSGHGPNGSLASAGSPSVQSRGGPPGRGRDDGRCGQGAARGRSPGNGSAFMQDCGKRPGRWRSPGTAGYSSSMASSISSPNPGASSGSMGPSRTSRGLRARWVRKGLTGASSASWTRPFPRAQKEVDARRRAQHRVVRVGRGGQVPRGRHDRVRGAGPLHRLQLRQLDRNPCVTIRTARRKSGICAGKTDKNVFKSMV